MCLASRANSVACLVSRPINKLSRISASPQESVVILPTASDSFLYASVNTILNGMNNTPEWKQAVAV